jgi:signal transduction histidine kinase
MGMVSHELRNVLSGMMLGAVLLESESTDTAEGQRIVDAARLMQRQGKRMARLIEDLVDVVRIDAGKLALKPTRCAAKALLNDAVETCAALAAEKGVALTAEHVDAGLEADFDRERLLQVLTNLIGNALKFTPAGGAIALQATTSGTELRLAVSDSGVGIPEALLGAVFERFRQVESTGRGLGLGLYICRCIVDSHGGRIWAESVQGVKTTFHVAIPGVAAAVASATSMESPGIDHPGARPAAAHAHAHAR